MSDRPAADRGPAPQPGYGLRVAVTNPFVWPHVRRGSERLLHDLTRDLQGRGHQVQAFAMAPQDRQEDRGGVAYHLLRERWRSPLRQLNSCHGFAFRLAAPLARAQPDAVFCLNYFDAFAAVRARHRGGRPFRIVFMAVGIPTRAYFRAVPLDAWFMATVLREADQVLVLSRFARERLRHDFGRDAQVLPPPVAVEEFAPGQGFAPSLGGIPKPRILFVGDAAEPRKGAQVLCRAFLRLKTSHPTASLVFSGHTPESRQQELVGHAAYDGVRRDIHFLGVGKVTGLPALYAAASVTVLPAVWEAFGLVLVESLAAGTPVVGARHGGIPDIIDDRVGRMFEPGEFAGQTDNVEGLAAALGDVLAQGKGEALRRACRERASAFSWEALGPAYERTLHPEAGA